MKLLISFLVVFMSATVYGQINKDLQAVVETESAGNTDYYYKDTFNRRLFEEYTDEIGNSMTSFNEGLTMIYGRGKSQPIGFANIKGELEIKLDPQLVGQIRPFSGGFAPIAWRWKEEAKLTQLLGAERPKTFSIRRLLTAKAISKSNSTTLFKMRDLSRKVWRQSNRALRKGNGVLSIRNSNC